MMYPNFSEGVAKIWTNDKASQEKYISLVGEETRGISLETFMKYNCFFVPNNDYLKIHFGNSCSHFEYEIYDMYDNCYLDNCLVFPCYTLNGNPIAWITYNPFLKLKASETQDYSMNYYSYPSKLIWNKNRYLFVLPEVYKKSLEDGYIILTDGVFDSIHLVQEGLNSASLLGSYLTPYSLFYLKFIPKVFVSIDNDVAGNKMYSSVKKLIPHAKMLKQGYTKDIDDFLKIEKSSRYLEDIKTGIANYTNIFIR